MSLRLDELVAEARGLGRAERELKTTRTELKEVREHNGRDAERYQWLRSNVQWGYPSPEGSDNPDAYLVITGYDHHYGKPTAVNAVDAAVDAAIARMKG